MQANTSECKARPRHANQPTPHVRLTHGDEPADSPKTLEGLPSTDGDLFRNAMSTIPAAVSVITAAHKGVHRGMTATAVCSLSTTPPLLLICVNQLASARSVISDSGAFTVNFLAPGQEAIARRFAQAQLDHHLRFEVGNWETSICGVPVLKDALTAMSCVVVSEIAHATHTVIIGRVVEIISSAAGALLYHGRRYCALDGLPVEN